MIYKVNKKELEKLKKLYELHKAYNKHQYTLIKLEENEIVPRCSCGFVPETSENTYNIKEEKARQITADELFKTFFILNNEHYYNDIHTFYYHSYIHNIYNFFKKSIKIFNKNDIIKYFPNLFENEKLNLYDINELSKNEIINYSNIYDILDKKLKDNNIKKKIIKRNIDNVKYSHIAIKAANILYKCANYKELLNIKKEKKSHRRKQFAIKIYVKRDTKIDYKKIDLILDILRPNGINISFY